MNHERIVVKGLKIFYQKYKKDKTIGKEPSYYVLGTYERWFGNFELNYIPGLSDYQEKPNFDINKIGKKWRRRKYNPHESKMEITKAMFDWLHKLSDDWKVIEEESQEVKDLDKKEDSDDWWWLNSLF